MQHFKVSIDADAWRAWKPGKLIAKIVHTLGLYFTALVVVLCNVRLIFDNSLWGDEAYSANCVRGKTFAQVVGVTAAIDNHPPLYYLYLKAMVDFFGDHGWVLHFASTALLIVLVLFALTLFKKRFGQMAALGFILFVGLAGACVEYGQEVRMYELAFASVVGAFYCAYRVLCKAKFAWVGVVLWGLVAAYSHHYGLLSAASLLFFTTIFVAIRDRGKSWLKGLGAMATFIVGYLPWLSVFLKQSSDVAGGWWMDSVEGVRYLLPKMLGSENLVKPVVLLFGLFCVFMGAVDFAMFFVKSDHEIMVRPPRFAEIANESLAFILGCVVQLSVLAAVYVFSALFSPIVAARYAYVLCGFTAVNLMLLISRVLRWGKEKQGKTKVAAGLSILLVIALLLPIEIKDYKNFSTYSIEENASTQELLNLVSSYSKDLSQVSMVSMDVKHLGWTVLPYYFPEAEIKMGMPTEVDRPEVWCFMGRTLPEETMREMTERGYTICGNFGYGKLSKYDCVVYYFAKEVTDGN